MKLWDRITRGMEAGFDAAITAVHTITEKAGESIEITRLRREKARLETELTRRLAKLGNGVYEKISADRLNPSFRTKTNKASNYRKLCFLDLRYGTTFVFLIVLPG